MGLPLKLPASVGDDYVAHLFVVRTQRREEMREHLQARGVATDVHYPVPDHRQAVEGARQESISLPHTEQACAEVVSLPCFPGMRADQVEQVIRSVRSYFGKAE